MGLICKVSGHKWEKGLSSCRCSRCGEERTHDWQYIQNGNCDQKCSLCGASQGAHLDNAHDWDGCVCKRCGKKRDKDHLWDGCKCRHCGMISYEDHRHDWNGCVCRRCRRKKEWHETGHDWDGCVCRRCGAKRNEGHDWQYITPGDCRQQCAKCGENRGYSGHDVFHDWDNCICKRCGCIEQYDSEAHNWQGLPECRKRCSVCGKIAYDHDFQQEGESYIDPVDDRNHVQMRCSKCGFTYATNSESEMNAPRGWIKCAYCKAALSGSDKEKKFEHNDVTVHLCEACANNPKFEVVEDSSHLVLCDHTDDSKICLICGNRHRFTADGDFEGTWFYLVPCVKK